MDDLIQEGSLLLRYAIDEYEPSKGVFSTFVYKKLENNIYYINSIPNSPIYFGCSLVSRYKKIKKYIDLGYDDQAISDKFQLSLDKVKTLRLALSNSVSYKELVKNGYTDFISRQDEQAGNDYIL